MAAENQPILKCHKTSNAAQLPRFSTLGAAGLDMFSVQTLIIPPRERKLVSTGIEWEIPEGYYIRIAPRSGLAWHNSVDVAAGVIDQDYRGTISVLMCNNGQWPYLVRTGDRIAQAIMERIARPHVIEVTNVDCTFRGAGSFGSTGK